MGTISPPQTKGHRQQELGFSLIEAMIGTSLVIFIAIAVLPAFYSLIDKSKEVSFRSLCNGYVRAKLQEYTSGIATTGAGTAMTYIPSAFDYAKTRYSEKQLDACGASQDPDPIGSTLPALPSQPVKSPGFREMVSTNQYVSDNYNESAALPERMLGFQLYVQLRLYNPRVLVSNQPARTCPPANYQFFRQGDAIEVTVTGIMRVRPTVAMGGRSNDPNHPNKWGGLDDLYVSGPANDPNSYTINPRLTCSATQLIEPPKIPFRYYLGRDGKIRNYQATLAYSSGVPDSNVQATESHFRSIWSLDSSASGSINSRTVANIRSIAVSPNNKFVYVLKPGVLLRYENCSDSTATVDGISFEATPNCSNTGSISSWYIDPSVEKIAVNFSDPANTSDDKVYGITSAIGTTNAGASGAVRQLACNNGSIPPALISSPACDGAPYPTNASEVRWIDPGLEFKIPYNPRVRGIFAAQSYPSTAAASLFFFDNSCYQPSTVTTTSSTNNWTYCVGVYNSSDTEFSSEVRSLPVLVEGISQ